MKQTVMEKPENGEEYHFEKSKLEQIISKFAGHDVKPKSDYEESPKTPNARRKSMISSVN